MTILDKRVCGCCCSSATTTIGDLFKLIVPIGWSVVALGACLAYLIAPLSRGDPPRWESAALVALSGVAGIGLSVAVYSFHRKTSSFAVEENYFNDDEKGDNEDDGGNGEEIQTTTATLLSMKQKQRSRVLKIHAILSSLFSILSIALVIFFGAFASDMDKCAHETCGADVSWSCITLAVSLLWMGVTYLGYRHLQRLPMQSNNGYAVEEGLEIP
mmetsp:Transcript_14620/g.31803  ORF Transcript_14620/g.31803 Transcript_14620/m.31803 type:complete len:215 (+) Transcript_14620:289-933(+)